MRSLCGIPRAQPGVILAPGGYLLAVLISSWRAGPRPPQRTDSLAGLAAGAKQLTMEGIWSLKLGLFRLEWARFLAQVPGAMLGFFLEGLNL